VKLGVTLPTVDLAEGRPLPLSEVADFAARAEAFGFDSAWVMDHYWLENLPKVTGAHDPFITLAYAAARTERIRLGILVACNAFRPLGQLARESVALADAAPGRFTLGLGCGWEESEFAAFDHAWDHRVSRLEETLGALPGLLRGERVTAEGRYVSVRDAWLVTSDVPPPELWMAAFGPRMLGLTARHASGWNTAWHGPDTSRFTGELAALREACTAAGRDPSEIEISAGLWMVPLEGDELEAAEQRAAALYGAHADTSWPAPMRMRMHTGSLEQLAAGIRAYADAGAEHVILNLSVTPFTLFDRSYLERAAPLVELVRS
jgi:alkanesulfonate monooxygenase SsuD/methylene tetrahydromethanopterin reductase-like flavin-dependent oxidoreductase (luciferase family)